MLRLDLWRSSHVLMLRKNIVFLFFFAFLFGYGNLMATPSGISASDCRYKLDVYISKCYGAARALFIEIAA